MPLVTKVRDFDVKTLINSVKKRYGAPRVRFRLKIRESEEGADDGQDVVTIEDPPRTLVVHYSDPEAGLTIPFKIWKPWSYFSAHFYPRGHYCGSSVFFSYQRLKNKNEKKLLRVPLPNISYDHSSDMISGVCLGKETFAGGSIEEKAIACNDHFWTSTFNEEISISNCANPRWGVYFTIGSHFTKPFLAKWEEKSSKKQRMLFRQAASGGSSIQEASEHLSEYIRT